MSEPAEVIRRHGHTIHINWDEYIEWDTDYLFGGMTFAEVPNRQFHIPGSVPFDHAIDEDAYRPKVVKGEEQPFGFMDVFRQQYPGAVALNIRAYCHSGCTITAYDPDTERLGYPYTDRYDSAMAGLIFMTLDQMRKWWGVKHVTKQVREATKEAMKNVVSEIDNYMTGQVYGYIIYKDPPNHSEYIAQTGKDGAEIEYEYDEDVLGEPVDSGSGMVGFDYCKEAAIEALDYMVLRYTPHVIKQTYKRPNKATYYWGVYDGKEHRTFTVGGRTYHTEPVARRFADQLNAGVIL